LDERLAQIVADWIDPDSEARFPDGAEDLDYLNQDPPYRTANGLMRSPSELLLIKDMDAETYERLLPFITTLPTFAPINVNTAPAEVLQALSDNLDATDDMVGSRDEEPFASTEEFINKIKSGVDDKKMKTNELQQLITVSSNYFLVHAAVNVGRVSLMLDTLIERTRTNKARVLSRSRGGF
jgi:general secretion pathway protein K